jgi:signal transduction histidine kinase
MADPVQHPGSKREAAVLSWIQQFAPYGVITLDESLRVQSWNSWMEQHSGRPLEEVAGQDLFRLYPELSERKLTGHFERALAGESSVLSTALHRYLLPLRATFPDRSAPQMLQTARLAPLFAEGRICGVVVVIEDVTQRESQAEALARQHRRDELLSWALASLLETEQPQKAVRQLFFKIAEQLDFDTFVVYLRDFESGLLALEAIGGVPIEAQRQFVACPFAHLAEETSPGIEVLNSLRTVEGPEYSALKQAGLTAAIILPLVAKHRNLGLLCFATGIRDEIAADEPDLLSTIAQYLATALDRESTNRQLHRAKELLSDEAQLLETQVQERTAQLRETVSELETFSYTLAHDLRAPARSMIGFCEILLENFTDVLPADARHLVQKIGRASRRMESLTRDLLEFSKVSRQQIDLATVVLEPILDEVISLQLPAVRQAITVDRPLHAVRGHRGLLEQVFSNLIDNAVKFVPPGIPPRITISSEPVAHGSPNTRARALVFSSTTGALDEHEQAPTEEASRHIRIWVRDEGIGIPRQVHEKIFGIFERGWSAHAYEGTGIGLAIVARAMQRMHGTCGVESELGRGSAFWIELPAA